MADRLTALEAENAALKAKLAGVDERALEVAAKRLCMTENGGDHPQNHGRIATAWLVSAERYRIEARAAIAAYLAAVRDGE